MCDYRQMQAKVVGPARTALTQAEAVAGEGQRLYEDEASKRNVAQDALTATQNRLQDVREEMSRLSGQLKEGRAASERSVRVVQVLGTNAERWIQQVLEQEREQKYVT